MTFECWNFRIDIFSAFQTASLPGELESPARCKRANKCGIESSIRLFGDVLIEHKCWIVKQASLTVRVTFLDFRIPTRPADKNAISPQSWSSINCGFEWRQDLIILIRILKLMSSQSDLGWYPWGTCGQKFNIKYIRRWFKQARQADSEYVSGLVIFCYFEW